VPVRLSRLAAPRCVFIFGISYSPLVAHSCGVSDEPGGIRSSSPSASLGGAATPPWTPYAYAPAFSTSPAPLPAASPATDPATGTLPGAPGGPTLLRSSEATPEEPPDGAGRSPEEPRWWGSLGAGLTIRFTGDSTIVMLRPSCFGAASTCEISPSSLARRSRSLAPSSVWAISRP